MPLPDLIEILPLKKPVRAILAVPGSKSLTNRALVLAALAGGMTELRGALWSEDTQVMVDGLQALGFRITVAMDRCEPGNRTITVHGRGGVVSCSGTLEQPLELWVGNAGTAARFLAALVCLGPGVYRLHGVPRMHERPQAALFEALRQLGYRIETPNNRLPALIFGGGPSDRSPALKVTPRSCQVSIAESSQFASALLLSAAAGGWEVNVLGDNSEESPYVEMTRQMCAAFPAQGGVFQIEPDASSGSYFLAAGWLLKTPAASPEISVAHWPVSGWQIDAEFPRFWPLPRVVSRQSDLGDSILTAIVTAPWAAHPVRFVDLGRLRVQECERVQALRTELTRCGARVEEQGDTLTITPSPLHGAEIETYQDHRLAMCFAILGLKIPGLKIKNPACVKKTFPNFFQKLANLPPAGLGAGIRDGLTGKRLADEELYAD